MVSNHDRAHGQSKISQPNRAHEFLRRLRPGRFMPGVLLPKIQNRTRRTPRQGKRSRNVKIERGAAVAERDRLQSGEPVTSAGSGRRRERRQTHRARLETSGCILSSAGMPKSEFRIRSGNSCGGWTQRTIKVKADRLRYRRTEGGLEGKCNIAIVITAFFSQSLQPWESSRVPAALLPRTPDGLG